MIVKKIKGIAWKKMLPYIFEHCDEVLFAKRYDIWKEENAKLIDSISLLTDINKPLNLIDYDILLKSDVINSILDSEGVLTGDIEYRKRYLSTRINDILSWRNYNTFISKFIDKYQPLSASNYTFHEDYMKETKFYGFCYKTIYIFKLNAELKELLLNSSSIYEWKWPYKIEDICFIRNKDIWLYTISNKHICEIFCENDRELEYLKSIGIEFESEFTKNKPISIDQLADL